MGVLNQNDLQFEYSWSVLESDDSQVIEPYDSTLLNRNEGYDVITFLNHFARTYNLRKENALKAERFIKYYMPQDINKRIDASRWLIDNLESYELEEHRTKSAQG